MVKAIFFILYLELGEVTPPLKVYWGGQAILEYLRLAWLLVAKVMMSDFRVSEEKKVTAVEFVLSNSQLQTFAKSYHA